MCQHQNGNKGKKWEFTNKRIEGEEEKKKFCGDEKKWRRHKDALRCEITSWKWKHQKNNISSISSAVAISKSLHNQNG